MPKRCRCVAQLARYLHQKTNERGACFEERFEDEEREQRHAIMEEAKDSIRWLGACRCGPVKPEAER